MKCVECRIGSRNNFPSDVSAQAHCGPLSILTLLLPARLPPRCLALSLLPSLLRWKKGEEAPCPKAEFVLMLSRERENAARLVLVTWASSFRLYAHSNIKLEVQGCTKPWKIECITLPLDWTLFNAILYSHVASLDEPRNNE